MSEPKAFDELVDWWLETAAKDGQKTIPKAVEYGSGDLIEMGHRLARVAGRTIDDAEAAEMGIWIYVTGKLDRWTTAVQQGVQVSDDTLLDIVVYAMMARRVRAVGGWPGVA